MNGKDVQCTVIEPTSGVEIKVGNEVCDTATFDDMGRVEFKLSAPNVVPSENNVKTMGSENNGVCP